MSENSQESLPFTPCADVHSVKEASVGIFVSSAIENIEAYTLSYEKSSMLKSMFPNIKSILKSDEGIIGTAEKFKTQPDQVVGFVMAQVDAEEDASKLFQGVNEGKRSYFSFHEMKYTRWAPFKEQLLGTLQEFHEILNTYTINGISLTYTDEYRWNEGFPIDYNLIFNKETEYLPPIFFKKDNTDADIVSTMRIEKDNIPFYVRLNIQPICEQDIYTLRIIHNAAYVGQEIVFEDILKKDNNYFSNLIQTAHELNKDLMKSLLLPSVINMINMK